MIWKLVQLNKKLLSPLSNDKSQILDLICNELLSSGIEILFRSERIEEELNKLSVLKKSPQICFIDPDFYDKSILS